MARERMAKLLKYWHVEGRGTYNHIFYVITKFCLHNISFPLRYLSSSPSDEDLAYTMTSAAPRSGEQNTWSKLDVQISRTKPKRHAMHPICPLILLLQLAAE